MTAVDPAALAAIQINVVQSVVRRCDNMHDALGVKQINDTALKSAYTQRDHLQRQLETVERTIAMRELMRDELDKAIDSLTCP